MRRREAEMKGIEISGISRSYGEVNTLNDVTLSVENGELFGLIGPDGAGKSTLYRILATLLLPDKGAARIEGLDVVKDFRRVRTLVGYMPERFSLYQDMTVKENLKFFASLFGADIKESYDLIAPVFRQLERFPNRKAGALSGGMKQKLALSCALIHRPHVLLLDEPTTGVDAVSRSEFWEMLSGLKEHGITILVSTSYMDEANLCQRIAMIDKGCILATGSPSELAARTDENLFEARAEEMFRLLAALREMPDVINCYTFGATIHIVARDDFSPARAAARLESQGLYGVSVRPAKGTIEDLFIKYDSMR